MRQLHHIDLLSIGTLGLNLETEYSILDPRWATVATNMFISRNGRLSSRKGYATSTTTPITATEEVKTLHEYIKEDATTQFIVAWDGGIANDIADPGGNDVSGAVTDTNGIWNFQNFNNKVLGFQNGQKPVVYSGTTFATVAEASGTAPTIADGVGLCAFGRVWGLDSDRQVIKFSALLDETHWSTGAGQIDMSSVWVGGHDVVTALATFGGGLVVFGRNHIIIWTDGKGNQLGLDPNDMYVADTLVGVGCESQFSIQALGEADLVFLSKNGVQTLSRAIQGGAAPVATLSDKVNRDLLEDLEGTSDRTTIRSVVHRSEGLYLLTFPTVGTTWVFHISRPFQDQQTGTKLYPVTTWDLAPTAWLWKTSNSTLYLGFLKEVGLYGSVDTDDGATFSITYEGPWMDLGEDLANRLKILKRLGSIIFSLGSSDISYKWDFDFRGDWKQKTISTDADGGAEWGIAEFNLDEFSGGQSLKIHKFPAYGKGQYIKVGVSSEVTSQISIQQIELVTKLGRFS